MTSGHITFHNGVPYVCVLEVDMPNCSWWRRFCIWHFSDTMKGYLLPIVEAKP